MPTQKELEQLEKAKSSLKEKPLTTKEAFHRSQLTLLKMRKKLKEKSKKSK